VTSQPIGSFILRPYARAVTVVLLVGLCEAALAVSSSPGSKIASIAVNRALGYAFVKLETPPVGKPACSNHYWDYTVPLATSADKTVYATLLAAFESGNVVATYGSGACSEFSQVESLDSAQALP
jgi:hypothetical protein